MKKSYSIFLCILFCAFIGIFSVLQFVLPDRNFSENENRYLAQMPTLEASDFFNGTFMSEFETYITDQFPARDLLITIKAACELAVGKTSNNDVYFGDNGILFAEVSTPSEESVEKNLNYVNALTDSLDVPVYFSLVPNKLHTMGSQLIDPPALALFNRSDPLALSVNYLGEDLWKQAAETTAHWVDFMPVFLTHAEEALFYRTDHHWTSLGAYYGYATLMEAMGITPKPLDSYEKVTVSTEFLGTTYSSSGAGWVEPDTIDTYVTGEGVSVTTWPNGVPETGSLYHEEKLTVKDKYSYFMGGNTPLAILETVHTDAPRILVIRDSYTDSLAPFLTEHFSQIHLFDLRYNNTRISTYVAENDIDAVVVLYSMANFLTDTNLFKMAR